MEKKIILFAVGHRGLEEHLENELGDTYTFVGPTVHKEGILKFMEKTDIDILLVSETLDGSANIMNIVYEIRSRYPKVRIVFLAGDRKPGDQLLAALVNYGVYDILYGSNIPAQNIITAITDPNTHGDVAHLQPVPILDEKRNRVTFKVAEVEEEDEGDEIEGESDELDENENAKEVKNTAKKIKQGAINKLSQGIKFPSIPTMSMMRDKNVKNEAVNKTFANRVITFIGGKNGVGVSSVGINVAFKLAEAGKRVIYIEVNEHYPAVSYWYELGLISLGIDSAIEAIEKEQYGEIKKAIIKSVDVKKENSSLGSSYKKFPNTLDFMFFSKEYITGLKAKMDLKLSKELYMHLLYQEDYDFVLIDVQPDLSNQATISGLMFSNLIFSVITQDVSSIGYHLFHINELEKRGLFVKAKNSYIINKYTKSDIETKEIKEWVDTEDIFTLPFYNQDFINANLKGLPVSSYSQNVDLKNSILKIVNKISE